MITRKILRLLPVFLLVVFSLALSGCGDELTDEEVNKLVSSSTCQGSTTTAFANAGFEAGNLTGWNPVDMASPFEVLRTEMAGVTIGCCSGSLVTAPNEGVWAMVNGWDGGGPDTIRISQDITVCSSSVAFDYWAAWNTTFGATIDRTFIVNIEPAGGGAPLQTDLILTAPANTTVDTGIVTGNVDVSAFRGQTVHLAFEWVVPENMTGPAAFQLDNIRSL